MKLSSYINEAQVDVMSMEEFNEVMDELEAVSEAHKAQSRLASLEALNVDTNSAQYRLAMETILTPVGLGDDMTVTAEDLKDKIAGVAGRLWAKVLRAIVAITDRFSKMYQGLKGMVVKHPPEMTFLRSWKEAIKRNSPDTADEVIKKLDQKLKAMVYIPHHDAYNDAAIGARLMRGHTKSNLAFTFLIVTEDGENKSTSNAGDASVVPHRLPGIIEDLSEACKGGVSWMKTLEKATKVDLEDAQIKRFQAALIAVTADAALVRKAQADIMPVYIALAHAAKKYGDKPTEDTKEK